MRNDSEILKDVKEELEWEPSLDADFINVSVLNGFVTLTGKTDAFFKREIAEHAAKRVAGVLAVFENLSVQIPEQFKKTDREIKDAALSELKWNTAVKEDKVKVEVENGMVTIDGEVEWDFQRAAVRNAIKNLTGVVGIINNVKLVPRLTANEIKQKIRLAFHRNATIDAEKIDVQTDGNKVILNGKVKSWMEKNEAENTAWLAPGVIEVENNLEIF